MCEERSLARLESTEQLHRLLKKYARGNSKFYGHGEENEELRYVTMSTTRSQACALGPEMEWHVSSGGNQGRYGPRIDRQPRRPH
jgi:hypothetical protein